MTLQEAIAKTSDVGFTFTDPTNKQQLAELRKAASLIISSNNRRITTAEKQKTRAQKFAYESSPMQRIRTKGDEFYLPTGRFSVKNVPQTVINDQGQTVINPEYKRLVQNARGFNNLKTTTGRGATERVDKMRERLRNTLAKENATELINNDKYIVKGTKGIFTGARLNGPMDITPDKFLNQKQYEAAKKTLDRRNREISATIKKIDRYIYNMSPDEVSNMYSEYRRYLDFLKANRQSKEYKDYEANNESYVPEKVLATIIKANLSDVMNGAPIAGWSDKAIQDMMAADVAAAREARAQNPYASRTTPRNATEAQLAASRVLSSIRGRKKR